MSAELLADLRLAKAPTSLTTFLVLYLKARKECYISYMNGAEELHRWLTTDGMVPLLLPPVPADYKLPPLLEPGYELQQLAKVIVGSVHNTPQFNDWLNKVAYTKHAIYIELTTNPVFKDLV